MMWDQQSFGDRDTSFLQRVWQINWLLVLLICLIASVGFLMLYSAADGDLHPWASRQMVRFGVGLVLMFAVALVDLRFWLRHAYILYIAALALLVAVEIAGSIGMGAQRWIDLKVFQLQPSETMKIALVLALARYFHGLTLEDVGRPLYLLPPLFMVFAPAILVLRQPDLGTTLMLVAGSGAIFWAAGVRLWKFALVLIGAAAAIPVAWQFLHEYQKRRVLTFLDPETDPLGAGYHILQSKIALGSGGLTGKGFLNGTQSHLNFVPEKQTDFIFPMLAEEHGLVGGVGLIMLYVLLIGFGFAISMRAQSQFGRLVAIGITTSIFLYVFINIAMVMGLIPVVGVPLPLISYGGTAMLTVLIGFGLLFCVQINKDQTLTRPGEDI